jgi:hypothetical protein
MKGTDGATLISYRDNIESFLGTLTICATCQLRWLISKGNINGTVYLNIEHGRRYLVSGFVACPECNGDLWIDSNHNYACRTDSGHALKLPAESDSYYFAWPIVNIFCAN